MLRLNSNHKPALIAALINKIKLNGYELTDDEKERISRLPDKKLQRLEFLVNELFYYKLFSEESFHQALTAASIKLPLVTQSSYVKEKMSGFTKVTLDSQVTFFIPKNASKNMTVGGAFGYVNQAFEYPQSGKPKWAVKWSNGYVDEDAIAAAKREVKHLRNAGMQAFFYTTKKSVKIVMDWQEGQSVKSLIQSGKIKDFSFEIRLKWCISLLSNLAMSYDKYVVHGDAHTGNDFINSAINHVTFIDYGKSKKLISSKGLFEESDVAKFARWHLDHDGIFSVEWNESDTSMRKQIIRELYRAMTDNSSHRSIPCSIRQALEYCERVLENLDNLDESKLRQIINSTLNRGNLTVDDVLHGNERPLRFSTN